MTSPLPPFGSNSVLGIAYPDKNGYSAGPAPGRRLIERQRDNSLMVWPNSVYGDTLADDAPWFNLAFSLLPVYLTGQETFPFNIPGTIRCAKGLQYNILTPIILPYAAEFDLNQSALIPSGSLIGSGSSGMVISWRGGSPAYSFYQPAGYLHDGIIVGKNAGNGTIGLNYGDGSGFYIERLTVAQFQNPSCVGIWEQNVNGYTEKVRASFDTADNTVHFLLDSSSGQTKPSHEYNQYDHMARMQKSQTCVKVVGGPFWSGIKFHSFGNAFVGGGSADGNSWWDLSDTTDGNITCSDSVIDIQAETTNAGTYTWQTINFGTGAKFLRTQGMIRFIGSNWTLSNPTASNFNHRGTIYEFGNPGPGGLLPNQTAPPGN